MSRATGALAKAMLEVKVGIIAYALKAHRGHVAATARTLGVSRYWLHKLIRLHRIPGARGPATPGHGTW